MRADATAAASRSGSSSTRTLAPASTVSTHSVDAVLERHPARARVEGEQDGLVQAGQPVDDAAQALRPDVGLAVDRGHDVPARLDALVAEDPRAPAGDRRELEARVGHHVADDLDPAADAFAE